MRIAVQYLESGSHLANITPADVGSRLRAAFDRLPIDMVLLGWNLPEPLVEVCAEGCLRARARLILWQPLLTGDGQFVPQPEWHTVGLEGEPVAGYQGLVEFTFVCPNKPAVQDAVLAHLAEVASRGVFQGVFFDRIRFPSPSTNPSRDLACFCEDCQQQAYQAGVDLQWVQQELRRDLSTPEGRQILVKEFLSPAGGLSTPASAGLEPWWSFRQQSVRRLVKACADLAYAHGLEVGLDCFTPTLTRMVGQDLAALSACCDWVKVMAYARAYGPASIPFEILGLVRWLISNGVSEPDALACLAQATGWPLPWNGEEIRRGRLSTDILTTEIQRGRVVRPGLLLAGMEMVEIPGVAELNSEQIKADIAAIHAGNVDGFILSWDLWHMPLERLALVGAQLRNIQ
jgi:hypothetical protein